MFFVAKNIPILANFVCEISSEISMLYLLQGDFNINHIYTIMIVDKIPTSNQCRSESFFGLEFGRIMVFVSNILSVCFLQQASLVIQWAFSMN